MTEPVRIIVDDTLRGMATIAPGTVHCCVTSPPYWGLRDYGVDGQIGLEATPQAYIERMVEVARGVRRVLRDDGTFWLNVGDSYAGSWGARSRGPTTPGTLEGSGDVAARQISAAARLGAGTGSLKRTPGLKAKDLGMIPWRLAIALQDDGWWIRSVVVWAKKSPMPESIADRPTSAWEPIFLLAKSERYFYDAEAVRQPDKGLDHRRTVLTPPDCSGNGHLPTHRGIRSSDGRDGLGANLRNVWHLAHEPYAEAHFATFPTEIPRRAIKAGTSERGCCPACGAPWRRVVAREKLTRERPNALTKRDGDEGTGNHCANTVAGVATRTTGWEPTCPCPPAEPVPCMVLDPFLGSGTTIAVARELGRHGVGCELNPEYAALARIRIGRAEKPATFVDPRVKDAPLFAS